MFDPALLSQQPALDANTLHGTSYNQPSALSFNNGYLGSPGSGNGIHATSNGIHATDFSGSVNPFLPLPSLPTTVSPSASVSQFDPSSTSSSTAALEHHVDTTSLLAKEVLDLAFSLKLKAVEQHNSLRQLQAMAASGDLSELESREATLQRQLEVTEERERAWRDSRDRKELETLRARIASLEEHITATESLRQSEGELMDQYQQRCQTLEKENEALRSRNEELENQVKKDKRSIEELRELNQALKMSISEQISDGPASQGASSEPGVLPPSYTYD